MTRTKVIYSKNDQKDFFKTLRSRVFQYFKEENHWTVALKSLEHGLKFTYKDLKIPNDINK